MRKDASTVPAEPEGKQQHVVETLNIIDTGTSVLISSYVRSDFTAETALQALAQTFAEHGLPHSITLDRDTRWVGVQRFTAVENSDISATRLTALVTLLLLASQGSSPCFPFETARMMMALHMFVFLLVVCLLLSSSAAVAS
jgi:acyl CoA:acetate/3-ketoacid CoA transferase